MFRQTCLHPERKDLFGIATWRATLKVAQSGTVALGGDLSLQDSAVLGFNYTGRSEPVLALEGKTVTFAEGATTNVTESIDMIR